VKFKKRRISALLDTGSDITVVGADLVKKIRWKVHSTEMPSVYTADGEKILLAGVIKEDLIVGGRSVTSEIFVSPDLEGMIIGLDWLRSQGHFVWDFANDRIKFLDCRWIDLHKEQPNRVRVRRIYVTEDTILPPAHQTDVPVRIGHSTWTDEPLVGIVENSKVSSLRHVISAQTVLPPKFTDLRVPVINLHNNDQVLVKGTKLGTLEKAEEVELAGDGKPLLDSTFAKSESKSLRRAEVIDQMIEDLPEEMNDEQRRQVKKLLRQNEGIFCKGEHDIGRTQLIEYRIDSGDHRPIRQPLRRQPFQHLEIIDKQVKDMMDAGIIESVASPWASNVVLVKKRDGKPSFLRRLPKAECHHLQRHLSAAADR